MHPGLLLNFQGADAVRILGPLGVGVVRAPREPAHTWQTVAAVGGLILGEPADVVRLAELLANPRSSRTASYIAALVRNAAEVVAAWERIQKSAVTVIGCGGIGSLVAVLLAGAGIPRLVLVDGDIVEESNLNRQLFYTTANVGTAKVDVLACAIRERYPDVAIHSVNASCSKEREVEEVLAAEPGSVLVLTADEPIGIVETLRAAASRHRRWLHAGGYRFTEGTVVHFAPLRSVDESNHETGTWSSLRGGIAPSFGPQNAQVASVLATGVLMCVALPTYAPTPISRWNTLASDYTGSSRS